MTFLHWPVSIPAHTHAAPVQILPFMFMFKSPTIIFMLIFLFKTSLIPWPPKIRASKAVWCILQISQVSLLVPATLQPMCVCVCVCRSRVAPLTALTHKPGHNTAHYSLWWVVIPVWSRWPCPGAAALSKNMPPLWCEKKHCRKHISSPRLWGAPSSLLSAPSLSPSLPPTLPLCLHSWPSSLLSSNCSSVLGNGGRKSQSFRRATMTIKNIFFGRKVRKRGRKRFSWDGRKEGGRWEEEWRWEAWAEMKEKSGKRDGRRWWW